MLQYQMGLYLFEIKQKIIAEKIDIITTYDKVLKIITRLKIFFILYLEVIYDFTKTIQ
jgi:hypothetical protein